MAHNQTVKYFTEAQSIYPNTYHIMDLERVHFFIAVHGKEIMKRIFYQTFKIDHKYISNFGVIFDRKYMNDVYCQKRTITVTQPMLLIINRTLKLMEKQITDKEIDIAANAELISVTNWDSKLRIYIPALYIKTTKDTTKTDILMIDTVSVRSYFIAHNLRIWKTICKNKGCANCQANHLGSKMCKGCKKIWYCSNKCQKKAWGYHKLICCSDII